MCGLGVGRQARRGSRGRPSGPAGRRGLPCGPPGRIPARIDHAQRDAVPRVKEAGDINVTRTPQIKKNHNNTTTQQHNNNTTTQQHNNTTTQRNNNQEGERDGEDMDGEAAYEEDPQGGSGNGALEHARPEAHGSQRPRVQRLRATRHSCGYEATARGRSTCDKSQQKGRRPLFNRDAASAIEAAAAARVGPPTNNEHALPGAVRARRRQMKAIEKGEHDAAHAPLHRCNTTSHTAHDTRHASESAEDWARN